MTDGADKAAARRVRAEQFVADLNSRYALLTTAVIALIGAGWAIYNWDEVAARESKKPILEKQLDLYLEASKITAKLTLQPIAKETWDGAYRRFWELRGGELVLVEDPAVSAEMAKFGSKLQEVAACHTGKDDCTRLQAELKPLSLSLTRAIRASLQLSWGYRLIHD